MSHFLETAWKCISNPSALLVTNHCTTQHSLINEALKAPVFKYYSSAFQASTKWVDLSNIISIKANFDLKKFLLGAKDQIETRDGSLGNSAMAKLKTIGRRYELQNTKLHFSCDIHTCGTLNLHTACHERGLWWIMVTGWIC